MVARFHKGIEIPYLSVRWCIDRHQPSRRCFTHQLTQMDIVRWKYAIIQRTAHRIQRRGYRMICHPTDLHDEYNVTNWWHHTAWNFYRVRKNSLIVDIRGELRTYGVSNFAHVNLLEALSWRCPYHRSDPNLDLTDGWFWITIDQIFVPSRTYLPAGSRCAHGHSSDICVGMIAGKSRRPPRADIFEQNLNIGSRNVQIQAMKKTDPSTLIRLGIGAIYVLGQRERIDTWGECRQTTTIPPRDNYRNILRLKSEKTGIWKFDVRCYVLVHGKLPRNCGKYSFETSLQIYAWIFKGGRSPLRRRWSICRFPYRYLVTT